MRILHLRAKSGHACAAFFNDPSKVDTQDCGKRLPGMSGYSCADFGVQRIYAAGLYSDEHLPFNRDVQARLCAGGAGMAVLPRPLGDSMDVLKRIDLSQPPPGRDTWWGITRISDVSLDCELLLSLLESKHK
ncbi:DNA-binding transcriptional LysR family regulator [Rhizobium mesoamericanum]|nr:DNA-binding transcriptional LysR family regulator [Rhizobium mesoamericanum]